MHRDLRIDSHRSWQHQAIELLIHCERDHERYAVSDLTFTRIEPGHMLFPSLRIDNDAAQALMDGLWECGIRPTAGAGTAGAMAATERHLADMRRLAFAKHLPAVVIDKASAKAVLDKEKQQ